MPIIGTAGHVDHGKSTLVEALTGRDPDRWAEEKARGLTIDLGFAWTQIGTVDVGFVDVPGHERFIKNMLAGVGALDVALFVIAADEGWMPQTEEHLAVLDLLDVRHGVVAVTRADLVDADLVELAVLETDEHLTGTTLEGWPIVPVSAVTGEGIDDLRQALHEALTAAGPPRDVDRPKLWVDRSFVISGAGVVVTGTLSGGKVTRDDALTMWPGARSVRVRSIQSHEHDVDTAVPGSRTALNLAGIETGDVPRGTLLAAPGTLTATDRVLVTVRMVRGAEAPLSHRGAYHFHVGTGSWPVDVRIVGADAIEHSGAALIGLPERLALEIGDRFILREVGRRAVVAGGRVLDPAPTGSMASLAPTVDTLLGVLDESPDARAEALLTVRGEEDPASLAAHTGGGSAASGVGTERSVMAMPLARQRHAEAVALVRTYHDRNPLRPGMPKAELASALAIDLELLGPIAATDEILIDDGATIRTADFGGGWGPAQESAWERARSSLLDDGLAVRRASQLELEPETFHALLRDGRVIRVAEDLVYLPEQIDAIVEALAEIEDGFTVAAFRDALGLSRRQAVPLLEWLDAKGWTSRRGDVRTVRRRPGRESSDAQTP